MDILGIFGLYRDTKMPKIDKSDLFDIHNLVYDAFNEGLNQTRLGNSLTRDKKLELWDQSDTKQYLRRFEEEKTA